MLRSASKSRMHRVAPSPPQPDSPAFSSPPSAGTRRAWSSANSSPLVDVSSLRSATLSARAVAVRGASEEAIAKGAAWTLEEARKWKYLPNVPPTRLSVHDEYYDDSLRELLDQAVVGVRIRVAEAISECMKVRDGVSDAEREGSKRLDEALRAFKDPTAEMLVRQAAHAQTLRASKSCSRLCAAMIALEDEAATAQSVHLADLRSLASRLVAQREAATSALRHELIDAEMEGQLSIRRLLSEIERLQGELRRRDAHEAALEAALEEERSAVQRRDLELALLGREIGERDDVTAGLEGRLRRASAEVRIAASELRGEEAARRIVQQAAADEMERLGVEWRLRLSVLGREFGREEETRHAELRRHRLQAAQSLAQKLAERAALETALNEQISRVTAQAKAEESRRHAAENQLERQARAMESELSAKATAQRHAATSFRQQLQLLEESFEARLAQQARQLEAERDGEARRYQGHIAFLTEQVEALKSSTSVKRSYLYWSGLRVAGGAEHVHEAIHAIGLADPSSWQRGRGSPYCPPDTTISALRARATKEVFGGLQAAQGAAAPVPPAHERSDDERGSSEVIEVGSSAPQDQLLGNVREVDEPGGAQSDGERAAAGNPEAATATCPDAVPPALPADIRTLRVAELRTRLWWRRQPTSGSKEQLRQRLQESVERGDMLRSAEEAVADSASFSSGYASLLGILRA